MAKQRTGTPSAHVPATEDALAFRAAVRDVKPLANAPPAPGQAKPKPRARPRTSAAAENLDASMPLIGAAAPDAAGAAHATAALSFQRPGVRTQVVRRLRRGLIPIEEELDLHGLGQAAAREQLADFLEYSRAAGRRCVRIIHGKGYRSGARGPVLKSAVDLWLRRHLDVMAFTSARPIDGGTGAVYVLLRA
jgi:DNA-nicking Smr family endonuclease